MPATSCDSRPGAGGGRGGSATGAGAGGDEGSCATTGGAAGFSGDGAVGAGGEGACCPASGAGAWADGAAASGAAGGEGEDGAEGAAFCAVEAGAGAGATGVVPRETGGRTLVSSIQKAAATATSTTPASKAHNQRNLAFPSRRSELSPMALKVDQAMLMNMSHVNERRDFLGHVVHQILIRHKNVHPSPCSRQSQPSCSALPRFGRQLM